MPDAWQLSNHTLCAAHNHEVSIGATWLLFCYLCTRRQSHQEVQGEQAGYEYLAVLANHRVFVTEGCDDGLRASKLWNKQTLLARRHTDQVTARNRTLDRPTIAQLFPKVHDHVRPSQPLLPILNRFNPLNSLIPHFLKMIFNIIFPRMPRCHNCFLPFNFRLRSLCSPTRPAHLYFFDYFTILAQVQITNYLCLMWKSFGRLVIITQITTPNWR